MAFLIINLKAFKTMKKIIIFLLANIICSMGAFCQEHVAHAIANEINVTYFANQNVVDYVSEGVSTGLLRGKISANLLRTSISNEYTVIVDSIPLSNIWPRDYIAYYHLEIGNFSYCIVDTISYTNVPNVSDYNYMFNASNSYGSNATLKPSLSSSSAYNMFAENTYALIINAVYNEYSNYEEYWNECSFMYQTLTKKYNIPKSHVKVLMADGGANGSISAVSTYRNHMVSLPKDLDGDGTNDVNGSATTNNMENQINYFESLLTSNDHLFIFIVGDSEYDPYNYLLGTDGIAYLKFWDENVPPSNQMPQYNYSAVSLAYGLSDMQAKTTILLDISGSDDFASNLEESGFQGTVITSGRNNSLAFHSAYPYGRFVYNWLCGMNIKNTIHGNAVPPLLPFASDPNNNDSVTMEESFNYAASFESVLVPYYSSSNSTWWKYMSFNDVARDVDLFIRDNKNDTGTEYVSPQAPFLITSFTWNSPDIYLRNQQDGNIYTSHDTLDLSLPGKKAYLYVKIRNADTKNYQGSQQYLHMFWTDTRNLSLPVPMNTTIYTADLDTTMYGSIGILPITSQISSGDSLLVCCEWNVPTSIYNFKQQNGQLPPLSYIAILSERPTLSYNSLALVKKYANMARSRKYVSLKAEQTYGYNFPIIGPIVTSLSTGQPTTGVLTLCKPVGDDDTYSYAAISDKPEINLDLVEDTEKIIITMTASEELLEKENVIHVIKIEDETGQCAGGIDIVVKGMNDYLASQESLYSGRISRVECDGLNMTIKLTEPADDGLQLRVECVGLAFNSITYNVKKDQETITIPKPTGKGNVVNVSLISKNKIADSYKFIQ